jgi:uncharacterized membrane protein
MMSQAKIKTAQILTYSGIIPFAFFALLPLTQFQLPLIDNDLALIAYGTVIASFISGIHWGIYLFKESPLNLFITSNIIALLAWASLLIMPILGKLVIVLCLGALFYIDQKLHTETIIEDWFFKIRERASLCVMALITTNIIITCTL